MLCSCDIYVEPSKRPRRSMYVTRPPATKMQVDIHAPLSGSNYTYIFFESERVTYADLLKTLDRIISATLTNGVPRGRVLSVADGSETGNADSESLPGIKYGRCRVWISAVHSIYHLQTMGE